MEPTPSPPHPSAVLSDLDSPSTEAALRALRRPKPPEHGARVVWEVGSKQTAKARSPSGSRWTSKRWWPLGSDVLQGTRVSAAGDVAKANLEPRSAAERPQTRRSSNALSEEAWSKPCAPDLPERPSVGSGGWERPCEKILQEVREHQTQHEHRVLELLEAHQKRLEETYSHLLREVGARGPRPSSQTETSATQPPAAGLGSPTRPAAAGLKIEITDSAASPNPSYTTAATPPKPSGCRRQSTASAPAVQSERRRPASWQNTSPRRSGAESAPGDQRLSVASAGPGQHSLTRELTSAPDRASSLAVPPRVGKTISFASQEDIPPLSPMAPKQMMRRASRTETWNNDEAVGDTELYRKKKVVEKFQRRLASTQSHVVKGSCSKRALGLISHPRFEMLLAIIICLNATSIGVQADWTVQNVGSQTPMPMKGIDYTFTIIFTFELVCRIAGEGTAFVSLKNKNFLWNMFDSLLVGTAITGDVVGMFVTFGANVSVIRLLRVLRLARAIRLIRVLRFFKDLRVMITGIAQSAKSLLWASGLLLIIIYMYAICVLQVVGDHLETLSREGSDGTHAASLAEFYGSLPLTVYTLFGCISGGHDWAGVAEPLVQIHPLMGLLWMVYVGFAVFCVLNVITGVFVENAFKLTNDDDDKAVLDMLESRKQWIHEIKDLFKLADKSNTGYVDWAEFMAVIKDVRVQAVFHRLGLDVEEDSASLLFELLDFGGTGLISLDDFAEGIQRVRGNARSIDICQLLHDNRELKRQLGDMMRSMDMLLCWQQGGGKMHAAADEV